MGADKKCPQNFGVKGSWKATIRKTQNLMDGQQDRMWGERLCGSESDRINIE
jgi:hypothetical protein